MFDKLENRLDKTTKDKLRKKAIKEKLTEKDIKELMSNRSYSRHRGAIRQR